MYTSFQVAYLNAIAPLKASIGSLSTVKDQRKIDLEHVH